MEDVINDFNPQVFQAIKIRKVSQTANEICEVKNLK